MQHVSSISVINLNMCVDEKDVSSTTAMLKLLRKHPGTAVLTLDQAVLPKATCWCGSVGVIPWSMSVTCFEPPLIGLPKDEAAMLLSFWHASPTSDSLSSSLD